MSDLPPHARSADTLLVPNARNKAGLDALVWRSASGHHAPLDSTVSPSHGVHVTGLHAAVQALGWTAADGWPLPPGSDRSNRDLQIEYFWTVPEELFSSWSKEQPPKNGTCVAGSVEEQAFKRTAQHAICIPRKVALSRAARICEKLGVKLPGELVA